MKLTDQERYIVLAGLKELYKASTDDKVKIAFLDIFARIKEQEEVDATAFQFLTQMVDRVLESLKKIQSPITGSEASLRADVLTEIYTGIKRKIDESAK